MGTRIGTHILIKTPGEPFRAYLPPPIPPQPPIEIAGILMLLDKANQAVGRLDGVSHLLPNIPLFLYMYIRKEAVMSSQIEGTQSSLSDLLTYENEAAPGAPADGDVAEVSSYVAAMDHGLARMRDGFPISLRLIREMHGILLSKGRGMYQTPGEFRTSQNWIGGTRPGNAVYVPPPPDRLMDFLDQFEKFLHAEGLELPILLKAAIAHLQFESIHPFLDGNGRLGRLLITLMLCAGSVLTQPMLYLSLYLKRHRQRYYELLQSVRLTGNWEVWIEFFLQGVVETAHQAADAAKRLSAVLDEDRSKIETLGRAAGSALSLHRHMQKSPIFSVSRAARQLALSFPTTQKSVDHLLQAGIIKESTGKLKGRMYTYSRYLDILSEGAEPIPLIS
jgi:Fic family protein